MKKQMVTLLLMIGIAGLVGCYRPSTPVPPALTGPLNPSPTEPVSEGSAQPILDWQGFGPWGDGDPATCKALQVDDSGQMTVGYCDAAGAAAPLARPEFAEMVARFAPFELATDADTLAFRGQGQVTGPAWQRAILAWTHWTAGEALSGQVCAACRTAMSWFLGPVEGQADACRHLTVLNYGYAYAEVVPCEGGTATRSTGGWLETDEWEAIDGWLAGRAPTYQDDSYLNGAGEQEMSEAEIAELDALARSIYGRLGSP